MFSLKIRSNEDNSVTSDLYRDATSIHPAWVHEQLGTESESELQAFLDDCEQGAYLRNPDEADEAGIYFPGPAYRLEASFERDGQLIDCSQPEVLGGENKLYDDLDEAIEGAMSLQDDLDDSDLDPSTTYSVRQINGQIVYSAA
jgi:hypothetical protein